MWVGKGCLSFRFRVPVFLGLSIREVVGVVVQFSYLDSGEIWQPFGGGEVPAPQGREDLCGKRKKRKSEK